MKSIILTDEAKTYLMVKLHEIFEKDTFIRENEIVIELVSKHQAQEHEEQVSQLLRNLCEKYDLRYENFAFTHRGKQHEVVITYFY